MAGRQSHLILQYLRSFIHRRGGGADSQLLERFVREGDETAFEVLVWRHGPMVLALGQRVLHNPHDAEDVLQATFLTLVRKAGSIGKSEALGSWLYKVAYRIALRARARAAKRGMVGRPLEDVPAADESDEVLWRELRPLLDAAIERLPEKYRTAIVLCDLQGKTHREAAEQLGCSVGTVSTRVTRARQLLRKRLAHRGLSVSVAALGAALAQRTAAAVPAALTAATVRTAARLVSAGGAAGIISASVAELMEGAKQAMLLSRFKIVIFLALAAGAVAVGAASRAALRREPPTPPQDAPRAEAAKALPAKPAEKPAAVTVSGRVLDPDGKPVRGAKLLFLWWFKNLPHKVWATSGADGRFTFAVARSSAANSGWEMSGRAHPYVLAAAEGYGFAVAPLDKPESAANLTLRLVKDDVPIRGRILNLEGKPIAGVRVRVNDLEPLNQAQLYVPRSDDLTNWLAALKANKKDPWRLEEDYLTELASPAFPLLFPAATTGADGRFELHGIGPERMVHLRVEGPTIATQIVNVMTRPSEKIRRPLSRSHPRGEAITYHGAAFEILAEPTKPVEGVVRDRDTGKPLAGVTIAPNKITNPWNISNQNAGLIQTTTDKDGRYRLIGLPKGEDNQLLATTDDLPYLRLSKTVENTPGLEPVTVDFALKRGIWVKGRVTEKTTGKPLEGGVGYYCFRDNPHHEDLPSVLLGYGRPTREDGSYRLVVVPGRGLIAVQVAHNNRYLSGVGAEKIEARHVNPGIDCFDTYPSSCQIPSMNTLVEINPKPGDESITCDLIVVPGRSLKGTVLGPDGKPLAGARQYRWDTLPGSEFTVWGLPEGKLAKPWQIEFVHEAKKLAGFVTVHGDENEPLQVRLQPWGTLTGRVVTPRGEPLTGMEVSCSGDVGDAFPDKQGRFGIEGLTPGLKYEVYVSKEGRVLLLVGGELKNLMVKPGETLDLGDVRVKSAR